QGALQGDPVARITRYLSAHELLLVLDTCEHVSDSVADLVQRVAADCTGVVVVCTSRTALGCAAEYVWPVTPLAVPTATPVSATTIQDVASVRLFVDRARRRKPDFELGSDNAVAVAQICR